mmetsp:Transcript_26957/g.56602  ORF Transcript_26957/g.56602 Transcript_26957/m.56602 type:complete len:316 (+) Transcript_26957:128-1075(+)
MKFTISLTGAVTAAFSLAPTAYSLKQGFAGNVLADHNEFKQFEGMNAVDRMMAVTKLAWNECMSGEYNDANACENLIDQELAAMNLSFPVDTVIIYTRTPESPTSNAWVIPMDENSMCVGKYGDGRLFYEFDWCVEEEKSMSSEDSIEKSRELIKPSKWTKMIAANKNVECIDVDGDGDLDAWHNKAMKVMGGDFEIACSEIDAYEQKVKKAKEEGSIVHKGCQKLPEINCLGLSGVDACRMIKEMVPYPNKNGKNMECFLQYLPDSPKKAEIERDLIKINEPPRNKVVIYAKLETNRVISIPRMTGPDARIGAQ